MLKPRTLALLCGVVCIFLFSQMQLGIQTSDDIAMMATTGALWDEHTLAIPHMQFLDDQVDIGRRGLDGKLYSKYGVGMSLAATPLYALGEALFPTSPPYLWLDRPAVNSGAGAILAKWTNAFLGSLAVAVLAYSVAKRWGNDVALLTVALLALGSPFWAAARGFGSEVGAGLGLLLAVLLAQRALRPEIRFPLWPSVIGLGVAALFRPGALAFGLAWLPWLWRRPRRDWLAVAAAATVVLATLAAFNWVRCGSLVAAGYGDSGSGFQLQIVGLIGYLVAPGRGLLYFAPWVFLIAPFALQAVRQRSFGDLGVAAGVMGFYLFHAMWREWEGGYAYGPRLLVPLLPALAVALAGEVAPRQRLAVSLLLPGLVLQVLSMVQDPIVSMVHHVRTQQDVIDTVWSLRHSIVALQFRAAMVPERFGWLAALTVVIAAAGLWAVAGWISGLNRRRTALRVSQPAQESVHSPASAGR